MTVISHLSALERSLAPMKAKETAAITMLLSSIFLLPQNIEGSAATAARDEKVIVVSSDLVRRMSSSNTIISLMEKRPSFTPKSELGRLLLAIRERAIAGGLQLLTEEEILHEVMLRRGDVL